MQQGGGGLALIAMLPLLRAGPVDLRWQRQIAMLCQVRHKHFKYRYLSRFLIPLADSIQSLRQAPVRWEQRVQRVQRCARP